MKNTLRRAIGLGLLAVCFVACSAGGDGDDNPPPAVYNYLAYVVNYHSGSISAFSISTITGALTAVAGSPFAARNGLSFIAIAPSGKFAYVVHTSIDFFSDQISGFSINTATGALTEVAGSPFAAGFGPVSIAVDPSGKFSYVANYDTNKVSAFSINTATGALIEVAGSPFAVGLSPQSIAIDPSGKFAYVTNRGSDNISAFSINTATGVLTDMAGSPFATGDSPQAIAVDPSGKFAYVVNNYEDNL